jgi:hypothetical protein
MLLEVQSNSTLIASMHAHRQSMQSYSVTIHAELQRQSHSCRKTLFHMQYKTFFYIMILTILYSGTCDVVLLRGS